MNTLNDHPTLVTLYGKQCPVLSVAWSHGDRDFVYEVQVDTRIRLRLTRKQLQRKTT